MTIRVATRDLRDVTTSEFEEHTREEWLNHLARLNYVAEMADNYYYTQQEQREIDNFKYRFDLLRG
jgi:hypothetical protein